MPGVTVRAAVHTRPVETQRDNVMRVDVDYDKPETVRAGAEGVDAAFLITPAVPNQTELAKRALEALQAARVPRLVRLSVIGADRKDGRLFQQAHATTEQEIVASGIPYTFLRPNSYMSGFLTFYAPGGDGIIRLPWGGAGVSHIDPRDVAAVAAHVLTSDGHIGKAYTLTGPEAITAGQIASDISEVSGRKIQYIDMAEDDVRQGMLAGGLPAMMVHFLLDLHAAYKEREMAAVTDTVRELTGRSARSFKEFARDHGPGWKTT
jgi:uncharacterized protein YbjT (DUF2867 family)